MKKTNKIIVVLIVIFLMISICSQVFALKPENYKPIDPTIEESEKITQMIGVIIGAIRNISAIVAVITIMIIGVKYMLGSVEEKANYKATMMPFVIGCVMAVAGTTLISFVYEAVH